MDKKTLHRTKNYTSLVRFCLANFTAKDSQPRAYKRGRRKVNPNIIPLKITSPEKAISPIPVIHQEVVMQEEEPSSPYTPINFQLPDIPQKNVDDALNISKDIFSDDCDNSPPFTSSSQSILSSLSIQLSPPSVENNDDDYNDNEPPSQRRRDLHTEELLMSDIHSPTQPYLSIPSQFEIKELEEDVSSLTTTLDKSPFLTISEQRLMDTLEMQILDSVKTQLTKLRDTKIKFFAFKKILDDKKGIMHQSDLITKEKLNKRVLQQQDESLDEIKRIVSQSTKMFLNV
jgi:hypothetical protein